MKTATVTMQISTQDYDADLLGKVPAIIMQRFAGTAFRIDVIEVEIEEWTGDGKQE